MIEAATMFTAVVATWVAIIWFRKHHPKERRTFREATIAYNAGPLIDRYVGPETRLSIIGGDGLPIYRDHYVWERYLKAWLKKGASIRYVLLQPAPAAIEKLSELRDSCQRPDQMSIYVIDWQRVEFLDRDRLERMKTFHFLVGESPKLLWIEREHKPGTVTATDCEFVPPIIAENDDRYGELQSIFETTVAKYGHVNVAPELVHS
jgi:hypothetical protein